MKCECSTCARPMCAYIYYWGGGSVDRLPCFWYEDEHPDKAGHTFEEKKVNHR